MATTGKITKTKQKLQKPQNISKSFKNKTNEDMALKFVDINSLKKDISNLGNLKKNNSFKSIKSQKAGNKTIKKKEKLNIKRSLLKKKIDTMKELKEEEKVRQKRKNMSVIGDTNPLHDSLPSLESLLENKKKVNCRLSQRSTKKRGIDKAKQRKKKNINDIDLFKRAINDDLFKINPFEIISNHIQTVVEQERNKAI